MEKITFTPEGGEALDFYVVEQTIIGGVSYLLVTETQEEEAEAYILKDSSRPEDTDSLYEFVEDETELDAVAGVFANMLEDVDLER